MPKIIESKPFVVKHDVEIHSGEKVPILTGRYLDFSSVANEDEDPFPEETRQKSLLVALDKCDIHDRPCMAMDLAPMRDIGAVIEGKEWVDPKPDDSRPKCAMLVTAASSIVDISMIKPPAGRSVIRANAAYPSYRWFQAINLLLHYQNKTAGRVIPFPLETDPDADHSKNPNPSSILYHALRVSKAEYEVYQRLLAQAVENDGVELGFFHAAKYAYEVLSKRGYKEITEKVVGETVTNVMIMGKPVMRGVLIENAERSDFTDDFASSHFVYA